MFGAILTKRVLVAVFDAMKRYDLPKYMSRWRYDAVFVVAVNIPEK